MNNSYTILMTTHHKTVWPALLSQYPPPILAQRRGFTQEHKRRIDASAASGVLQIQVLKVAATTLVTLMWKDLRSQQAKLLRSLSTVSVIANNTICLVPRSQPHQSSPRSSMSTPRLMLCNINMHNRPDTINVDC